MPSVLATGSYDHTIRLWEVSNGFCYRTLQFQDSVNIVPFVRYNTLASKQDGHFAKQTILGRSRQPSNTSF